MWREQHILLIFETKRLAIKCRLFSALSRSSNLWLVLLPDYALSQKRMFFQSSRLTALQPSIYPFLRIIWQQIWHDLATVEWLDVWREKRGVKQLCNREGRQDITSNVSADQKCDVGVALWTKVWMSTSGGFCDAWVFWACVPLTWLCPCHHGSFRELSLDIWMEKFHTLLNITRSLLKGKMCFRQMCKLLQKMLQILWFLQGLTAKRKEKCCLINNSQMMLF